MRCKYCGGLMLKLEKSIVLENFEGIITRYYCKKCKKGIKEKIFLTQERLNIEKEIQNA